MAIDKEIKEAREKLKKKGLKYLHQNQEKMDEIKWKTKNGWNKRRPEEMRRNK